MISVKCVLPLLAVCCVCFVRGFPDLRQTPDTCGYQSCNGGQADMLNIHFVPHTHDDVGWLKTVDQYYYGANSSIQQAEVQYILDTVIPELIADPEKKFIYVEVAFFYRWWNEQSDSMRHQVKGLVNNGQLEFILGGWSMNDEASTHYNAIIDQHTLGFRFLQDTFGECGRPHVGWQIDPFGHSREQASIFAQFGFDGLFFGRLDYQDKEQRQANKTMELMWQGSENLGEAGMLFTGVNYNGYSPPPGFCYDIFCKDDPIMDDPSLDGYNVDERVSTLLKYAATQASTYTTNHIMLTMGSDFQFSAAHKNYKNMDKLIKYINKKQATGSKVNAFYSSPNCYLYSLNQANQTYTTKQDDFFPYAHKAHAFWTGYFTSRAALKRYVRHTNNFYQVCKQLDALALLGPETGSAVKIKQLAMAMGIVQHHDAVSGTEKQHVANDYSKRLARAITACQSVVQSAYGKLLAKSPGTTVPSQHFCVMDNITRCAFTENQDKFTVVVYNPVGRTRSAFVQVPVTSNSFTVQDANLKPVTADYVPLDETTRRIPEWAGSKATGSLLFQATVPALGFTTFFAQKNTQSQQKSHFSPAPSSIKNEYLRLDFDAQTGLLKGITNLEKSITASVSQSFLYYDSMPGHNQQPKDQASGAYIFRPKTQVPTPVATKVETKYYQGKLVQQVTQNFSSWVSQEIRLYAGARYVELEWTVGPIPIPHKSRIGKEVISYFKTDLDTSGKFFTDANGREILSRVRDYRPTWKLNQTEPVAGNYYPINSRIYIQDVQRDVQLTVLTDRSQGGGSIHDGDLEIMVHRRTLYDDSLGVGEPLNETGADHQGLIIRGKHYVLLDTLAASGKLHRDLAERLYMAPVPTYASLQGSPQDYTKNFQVQWSGLYQQELPANVHLLTLEAWRGTSLLIRLEHFYEKHDDPILSKPANVSLKGLFRPFDISSVTELTLGANQELVSAKRLQWNVQDYGRTKADMSSYSKPVDPHSLDVTLEPMQIRTFRVNISSRDTDPRDFHQDTAWKHRASRHQRL